VLCLGHGDLIRIARVRLVEQVQAILVWALVATWHHHCLHVVRIESHLLGVDRFLLAHLARLDCDALRLHVNCSTCALVTQAGVGLALAALRGLLLGEAHVLRLHHI